MSAASASILAQYRAEPWASQWTTESNVHWSSLCHWSDNNLNIQRMKHKCLQWVLSGPWKKQTLDFKPKERNQGFAICHLDWVRQNIQRSQAEETHPVWPWLCSCVLDQSVDRSGARWNKFSTAWNKSFNKHKVYWSAECKKLKIRGVNKKDFGSKETEVQNK